MSTNSFLLDTILLHGCTMFYPSTDQAMDMWVVSVLGYDNAKNTGGHVFV